MQGTIPRKGAHIYFLGICGTAMGNVAVEMARAGHRVSGADTGIYPPMSEVLRAAGIPVREGYDADRLRRLAPDLVVVGNAASRGNPEVEWLLETRAIPFVSLPQLIGERFIGRRAGIVIAGTHGKTTTSALCAFLLREAGHQPGWLIGGVPHDLPGGCAMGAPGAPFVCEGDEYDCAFFDKRSKFVHYRPRILCLGNLEFDHADIFRDIEDIRRGFAHVCRLVPAGGAILLNGDDPELARLPDTPWCPRYRVGEGADNDLVIAGFAEGAGGSHFELSFRGREWARIEWGLRGRHNARNAAMASLAAALALSPDEPTAFALEAAGRFRGVRRRLECLARTGSATLYEDFAHHPTAVAVTLEALRQAHPGARLLALFEPRSNTARSDRFQERFAGALASADVILLAPVLGGEGRVGSGRLDPEKLARTLRANGADARAHADFESLAESALAFLTAATATPVVCVILTNGSCGGIIPRLTQACAADAAAPKP